MNKRRDQALHSVEEFVTTAKTFYGLSDAQCRGFVIYMKGIDKYYLFDLRDFIVYLKKYLNV